MCQSGEKIANSFARVIYGRKMKREKFFSRFCVPDIYIILVDMIQFYTTISTFEGVSLAKITEKTM